MPGEDKLIQHIARAIPSFSGVAGKLEGVELGIGDDAMVIPGQGGEDWVVTVDAFAEGVHFLVDRHPPESVGYKSLARAASDVAAMGAHPRFFLLTLGLPLTRSGLWLDRMLKGMAKAARALGIRLVGGDTTQTANILMSLTVIGRIRHGQAITRSGAKPGDLLYVSGRLGQAMLGLELVLNQHQRDRSLQSLLKPHLYPRVRVELGAWLASNRVASAMIDISDGLSTDLARLCSASGVGAQIAAGKIPVVAVPMTLARRLKHVVDPIAMALHGGEDYELLFSVPKRRVPKLRNAPGFNDLTEIGKVVPGKAVMLIDIDGGEHPLLPRGWDPFGRASRPKC